MTTSRLVMITGASSGVGAAAAKAFCDDGATVVLVARSLDKLQAVADAVGELAVPLPCDAADPDDVSKMANQVLTTHGCPDVIIHSAGAGQWKTVQDTTPQEAMIMMQAPYFAAFNVTHAFLPAMLARNSGVIISVNTPACMIAWPSSAGYAAARSALRGFSDALSQDLVGTGLHACNAIFGKIDSPYFDNNPGVADKLPSLDRLIPTLSTDDCATILIRLAQRPQHTAVFPFMLRPNLLTARLFPRFARWLLRF